MKIVDTDFTNWILLFYYKERAFFAKSDKIVQILFKKADPDLVTLEMLL